MRANSKDELNNQPIRKEKVEEIGKPNHDAGAAEQLANAKGYSKVKKVQSMYAKGKEAKEMSQLRQQSVLRHIALTIVHHWMFDMASGAAIAASAIVLAAEVEHSSINLLRKSSKVYTRIQDGLLVFFVVELLVRAYALRRFFWTGSDKRWNIFDLCVVLASLVEKAIEKYHVETTSGGSFQLLRLLRLLRLVRVIRVIRVVKFFKELRMMVYSILASCTSLFWGVLMLGMVMFLVGVPITQDVTDFRLEISVEDQNPQLEAFFGSLHQTMLTLFQSISGGLNWRDMCTPLQELRPLYALIASAFISFNMLAVLNIITGIFVTNAISTASRDQDVIIEDQLDEQNKTAREILSAFSDAVDPTGYLELESFERHVSDDRVRAYFNHLGLDVSEAWGLFRLLDTYDQGRVDMNEFVMGCMRLKGAAKSVDVATLLYENKRIARVWTEFMQYCEFQFSSIERILERIVPPASSCSESPDI